MLSIGLLTIILKTLHMGVLNVQVHVVLKSRLCSTICLAEIGKALAKNYARTIQQEPEKITRLLMTTKTLALMLEWPF